jgi:adenylate kinase
MELFLHFLTKKREFNKLAKGMYPKISIRHSPINKVQLQMPRKNIQSYETGDISVFFLPLWLVQKKNFSMINLVLFGPPGAGKGTQSEYIIKKYDLVHLSTGDIFRANIKGQTELGNLAKSYMDKGQLVPDQVTISLLESEVNKHQNAKGFIFDGFPRTTAQAQALDTFLASKDIMISLMISLEVEEEELKVRLAERAKTSGRVDDADPKIIAQRIATYKAETTPVKGFYDQQGKLRAINGIGTIDAIFDLICKELDQL